MQGLEIGAPALWPAGLARRFFDKPALGKHTPLTALRVGELIAGEAGIPDAVGEHVAWVSGPPTARRAR